MDDSLESMRPCPPVNNDLIEYLDRLIPHRCPSIADSDRSIWIYSGKRELVEFLKKRHEDQVNRAFAS